MKRRGASLIWAVVLCGVMMLVVGTMSAFIIKESRMSIRMDDSARAYAAAESGLDWGKLCLVNYSCRNNLSVTTAVPFVLNSGNGMALNGAKYYVKISINAAGEYTINSRGESNLVNREIEYKFEEANSVSVDRDFEDDGLTPKTDDDYKIPTGNITANGSFTLGFYYWVKDAASMADNAIFGVQNPTNLGGKDEISVAIKRDKFDLNVFDQGMDVARTGDINFVGSTAAGTLDLPAGDAFDAPYSLYISIKYLRNTSARLTVMLYNPVTGNYDCRGTKTVYLPNKTLSFGLGTTTKFVHEFLPGTTGNFERIEGKPAVDSGSHLNEVNNYLYRFITTTGSPQRFGYLDNFSSTGIAYSPSTATYGVTATSADATMGSVSASQSTVTPGGSAVLTATANPGYIFSSWSGDCFGTTNPLTLSNIMAPKACTANFTPTASIPITGMTVTGTAQVGSTLTATVAPAGANVNYRWQSCTSPGVSCALIAGAQSSTYTLTSGDLDKYIRVTYSAVTGGGYSGTGFSNSTAKVTAASMTGVQLATQLYPNNVQAYYLVMKFIATGTTGLGTSYTVQQSRDGVIWSDTTCTGTISVGQTKYCYYIPNYSWSSDGSYEYNTFNNLRINSPSTVSPGSHRRRCVKSDAYMSYIEDGDYYFGQPDPGGYCLY